MVTAKIPEQLELNNIDDIDISFFITKIESHFQINFYDEELIKINTFGLFCDLIVNKLEEKASNDCTTQQAFYRIRKALTEVLPYNHTSLTPDTRLEEIFPLRQRTRLIKRFTTHLGIRVQLRHPIRALFLRVFPGAAFANQLQVKTIRELSLKLVKENYLDIRRTPSTVNEAAIVREIKTLFKNEFGLEDAALHRDAGFN